MPIEPPDPTGKILDALLPALADLRAAAESAPADAAIAGALGHVTAAVTLLRLCADPPADDTPREA